MKYRIENLDKEFSKLAKDNKLDISTIEELAIKNIDDYKDFIHRHIEELIKQGVEEKRLIVKKQEWKNSGYNLRNKRKIEFTLITNDHTVHGH